MQPKSELWLCAFGVIVSILLKSCTSIHSYSGEGIPPLYGDYEAQRHWMEISVNLPVTEWYTNSTENDLQYWGLDYPPLTAYHSWICGQVARMINPKFVTLFNSRGYESEDHKLFMRYTVLLADFLIYLPAVLLYFKVSASCEVEDNEKIKLKSVLKDVKRLSPSVCTILTLIYPGLILIDHGHFQYNCISLGFTVFAVTFLHLDKYLIASVMFCLALNYKQMELYHAIPFFIYLLSTCVPKPGHSYLGGFLKLLKISLTVVVTFIVLWAPFLANVDVFLQVVHRVFPLQRGVFEDKVANFWCSVNVVYKLRNRFSNLEMARYCFISTLIAVLPSSIDLFLRPNLKKFVLALINSSLAFFLFSFQVHEKSILLVAIPVCLYLRQKPVVCFWFLILSTFSMFPLFVKDHLVIAFVSLVTFFTAAFRVAVDYTFRKRFTEDLPNSFLRDMIVTLLNLQEGISSNLDVVNLTFKHCLRNRRLIQIVLLYFAMWISMGGCVILLVSSLVFAPPKRYPDLFPVLISVYCCVHFLGFFLYFNVCQLKLPQAFDVVRMKIPKQKVK